MMQRLISHVKVRQNKRFGRRIIGLWIPLLLVIAWIVLALLAPLLPLQPNEIRLEKILVAPQWSAWFGYDDLGRPIFDRAVMGARTSLIVAFGVVTLSTVLGTIIGLSSAYFGGRLDAVVVFVIDIFLAFPGVLLAIALAGIMGPGIDNVIIALSVVGWVGFARLARAQVFSVKEREHVQAAQALGTGHRVIVFKHVLPLILAPLIVEASFGVASVIIAEAGLSFIGLGVQPPQASWGTMIRDGARYMLVAPHAVILPGIALASVILAINLLGDRLRDLMDVKQRLLTVK